MVGSRLRRRVGMTRESGTVRRAARTRRAGHHGDKSTHVGEASVTTVGPHDNVFAALNLPDADEWLAKAELARAIQRPIGTLGPVSYTHLTLPTNREV